VIFLINGIDEQVLFTGDACNNHYQFETLHAEATVLRGRLS
jgi:hypothetical protein